MSAIARPVVCQRQEVIDPAALRLVDRLGCYENAAHVEELHHPAAGDYVLVVNNIGCMVPEADAFSWLLSHGFEDMHLDILLDRISDVRSAYE